jgi:hypothetical protein
MHSATFLPYRPLFQIFIYFLQIGLAGFESAPWLEQIGWLDLIGPTPLHKHQNNNGKNYQQDVLHFTLSNQGLNPIKAVRESTRDRLEGAIFS